MKRQTARAICVLTTALLAGSFGYAQGAPGEDPVHIGSRVSYLQMPTAPRSVSSGIVYRTGMPDDAKALFDTAGVDGTMVVYDVRQQRTLTYNPERAATAFSPASTFKIFNSLIALETSAVADVDHDMLVWMPPGDR